MPSGLYTVKQRRKQADAERDPDDALQRKPEDDPHDAGAQKQNAHYGPEDTKRSAHTLLLSDYSATASFAFGGLPRFLGAVSTIVL